MASIGFIGVGKLGQACAEMVAEVHDVVGYDVNPVEPENFTMVDNMEDAVKGQDIVFIAVPTPHDPQYDGKAPTSHLPNKDFDYTIVKDILSQVNAVATQEQLVVLISTVLPGTVRRELAPLISNTRFVYNPYLIAMGTVKWDMVNPEMVMIGTEDGNPNALAKELIDLYDTVMENNPRYEIGTWDECEAIKIFYNTFISAKIGLANMVQDFAMKIGNIDVDVVTNALAKSDMRIMGPKYMTAGMGDAGACHPRDNIALRWLAQEYDVGYDMFDTIMAAREAQAKNLAQYLVDVQKQNVMEGPIVIHGKAYKPDVEYCIGSYSTLVGHYVKELGHEVVYVDPLADDKTECVDSVDVPSTILMAHDRQITYGYTGDTEKQKFYFNIVPGSVVVDPWRKLESTDTYEVQHYGNTR